MVVRSLLSSQLSLSHYQTDTDMNSSEGSMITLSILKQQRIEQYHQNFTTMDQQQYEHESQCEDYADYGPEGYHPVVLGEKFNHTYVVIQKLGWGHFSTVWLVQNEKTKQYAALKIQRSKQSHSESAIDQMKILNQIRRHEQDPRWIQELATIQKLHPDDVHAKLCRPLLLYDNFTHHGIHGKHYCSVFQILGPNLLDLIQHYQFKEERMPLWLVKKITIDVLLGLVYLHQYCDIIHTDLKPENIMIKMEPEEQMQLIQNIKQYKVKPISMKYLKNMQTSKNSKNKKKNEKKKLKKKLKKQQGNKAQVGEKQEGEKEDQSQGQGEQSIQVSNDISKSNAQVKQNDKKMQAQQKSTEKIGETITETKTQNKLEQKKQQKSQNAEGKEEVDMKILKWKNVKIQLNKKLFFKVVDMGNACFSTHHFTQQIQTRQYRSPEVILGYSYGHNTDIWSLGCTVFELLTNNFLFKPKPLQGISKDEDHLYKIIEVLGPMSKQYCLGGSNSDQFFNKKGKLLHGHPKQQIKLHQLLHEDYEYSLQEAVEIEQFLLPMLEVQDQKRVSARECLKHEWLWK